MGNLHGDAGMGVRGLAALFAVAVSFTSAPGTRGEEPRLDEPAVRGPGIDCGAGTPFDAGICSVAEGGAARRDFALADLRDRCVSLNAPGPCEVKTSGRLRRPRPGQPGLWWQLQTYGDEGEGVVVLQGAAADGSASPLAWDVGGWHEPPKLTGSPAGRLLVLPGESGGTAHLPRDLVLQETAPGRWRELDVTGWRDDLDRRLPEGLGIWKGAPVNYGRFTVVSRLWRDSDANCCPTGGQVEARLRLEDDALVLVDSRVRPAR